MGASGLPASGAAPASSGAGPRRAAGGGQQSPVIVLAYAQAGAARLQRLLTGSAALACTSGTGVLPLCDQAAATWREVDNRDGTLSPLALASIRALADSMITTILAGGGGSRWCEISFSPPDCAETFLKLYPAARFVCLHRSCLDVIRVGVRANPWGLAGSAFAPFAAAYPGSSAAAIAAYWAARTGPLLQFEEAHPGACRRVRYEDLVGDPEREVGQILAFLNLGRDQAAASAWMNDDVTATAGTSGGPGSEDQVPPDQIAPPLRARINDLQARIGYPLIT
jgi:Sulfotransferase family